MAQIFVMICYIPVLIIDGDTCSLSDTGETLIGRSMSQTVLYPKYFSKRGENISMALST